MSQSNHNSPLPFNSDEGDSLTFQGNANLQKPEEKFMPLSSIAYSKKNEANAFFSQGYDEIRNLSKNASESQQKKNDFIQPSIGDEGEDVVRRHQHGEHQKHIHQTINQIMEKKLPEILKQIPQNENADQESSRQGRSIQSSNYDADEEGNESESPKIESQNYDADDEKDSDSRVLPKSQNPSKQKRIIKLKIPKQRRWKKKEMKVFCSFVFQQQNFKWTTGTIEGVGSGNISQSPYSRSIISYIKLLGYQFNTYVKKDEEIYCIYSKQNQVDWIILCPNPKTTDAGEFFKELRSQIQQCTASIPRSILDQKFGENPQQKRKLFQQISREVYLNKFIAFNSFHSMEIPRIVKNSLQIFHTQRLSMVLGANSVNWLDIPEMNFNIQMIWKQDSIRQQINLAFLQHARNNYYGPFTPQNMWIFARRLNKQQNNFINYWKHKITNICLFGCHVTKELKEFLKKETGIHFTSLPQKQGSMLQINEWGTYYQYYWINEQKQEMISQGMLQSLASECVN